MKPASTLSSLVDSYLDLRWQMDPVEATAAGLSVHDDRLGRYGVEDIRHYVSALKSLSGALEACQVEDLDEEIDRTALLNEIRVSIRRFEREKPHIKNPAFWSTHALQGLYGLLVSRDRSRDERARGVAARVRAIPAFLESATKTLADCPTVFVETAVSVTKAGRTMVQQVSTALAPDGDESFGDACQDAVSALDAFTKHLEGTLAAHTNGRFAIGEDDFNFRLRFEHALSTTAGELWRYGHRLIDDVKTELEDIAAQIQPGEPVADLIARLRDDHPSATGLVDHYTSAMERARQFVEARGLVTIPSGALEVVETPEFLKPLIPFAAYQPPGAFSADRTGRFYVTAPPQGAHPDEAERLLSDHCQHEIACTALHEGYPGHHLQFLTAQAQPRRVRQLLGTPVTIEGWALYCEDMMGEQGFYDTLEEQLFQRVALLWRAVRIVLDVGLHARGMPVNEAIDFMVEHVHFERANAAAEVRRYCAYPAYQLCYAVGRRELRALRDAYEIRAGPDFTLASFHADVLQYGGLPVSLMRWGLGLDE